MATVGVKRFKDYSAICSVTVRLVVIVCFRGVCCLSELQSSWRLHTKHVQSTVKQSFRYVRCLPLCFPSWYKLANIVATPCHHTWLTCQCHCSASGNCSSLFCFIDINCTVYYSFR